MVDDRAPQKLERNWKSVRQEEQEEDDNEKFEDIVYTYRNQSLTIA